MSLSPRAWKVPFSLRKQLQMPFGDLVDINVLKFLNQASLITVGDVVSLALREEGIKPHICVYDGMTERREMTDFAIMVKESAEPVVTVKSPAGTISRELYDALKNALLNPQRTNIRVEGEEDLATLACILLAPSGRNIVYGWPGKGMLLVTTTDNTRMTAQGLWKQLEELE